MTPYSEAATPAPPINFAQWDEEKALPSVATLGLSSSETQILLHGNRYALTELMGDKFAHLFRRSSGKLNTKGRALAAFEHYDRRTTYERLPLLVASVQHLPIGSCLLFGSMWSLQLLYDCLEWPCCRDRKFTNMRFDATEA